jgi:ADP-heptose:LPS heptosyltransferase
MHLAAGALSFKFNDADLRFPIATDPGHVDEAAAIIERVGPRFAILNPGGGWVTKLWPAARFGELADRIYEETGMASVVATGPNESELARVIADTSRIAKLILTEPSLKGFYELAKRAAVYIGGDTGPTHIAVAAGAPVVGLFGPTEWWRNGSLAADDICVERTDIACRTDCHRRTCSNWICMDIGVDHVFQAVAERLRRAGPI